MSGSFLGGKLLGSAGLGRGVQVLDLGLAEDARSCYSLVSCGTCAYLHVRVAGWRFVHIRLADDEEDLPTTVSQFYNQRSGATIMSYLSTVLGPLHGLHSLPWVGGG